MNKPDSLKKQLKPSEDPVVIARDKRYQILHWLDKNWGHEKWNEGIDQVVKLTEEIAKEFNETNA